MPRRNRPQKRRRRHSPNQDPAPKPATSTEAMAHQLVRRGLVSTAVLGTGHNPHTTHQENR